MTYSRASSQQPQARQVERMSVWARSAASGVYASARAGEGVVNANISALRSAWHHLSPSGSLLRECNARANLNCASASSLADAVIIGPLCQFRRSRIATARVAEPLPGSVGFAANLNGNRRVTISAAHAINRQSAALPREVRHAGHRVNGAEFFARTLCRGAVFLPRAPRMQNPFNGDKAVPLIWFPHDFALTPERIRNRNFILHTEHSPDRHIKAGRTPPGHAPNPGIRQLGCGLVRSLFIQLGAAPRHESASAPRQESARRSPILPSAGAGAASFGEAA